MNPLIVGTRVIASLGDKEMNMDSNGRRADFTDMSESRAEDWAIIM
jgi:hypothetical protein